MNIRYRPGEGWSVKTGTPFRYLTKCGLCGNLGVPLKDEADSPVPSGLAPYGWSGYTDPFDADGAKSERNQGRRA